MNLDVGRQYLAAKPGATEDFPFDAHTLVFKVGGKMFALVALDKEPLQVSLKCDPEEAEGLRAAFAAVRPGYHLSKRHWNTVTLDGTVPDDIVHGMMDDSYALVVKSLTRAAREELAAGD